MAKSSIKCPGCGKMVYVVIDHAYCINCKPEVVKSLGQINKEYAKLNKEKRLYKKEV